MLISSCTGSILQFLELEMGAAAAAAAAAVAHSIAVYAD